MASYRPTWNATYFPSFAERFNDVQRARVAYHRFSANVRRHPVASLFLGTFLATSAIPLMVFLCFVFGAFLVGGLTLLTFQGGVMFIGTVSLLSCLLVPLFLSSGVAVACFVAWTTVSFIRRLIEPLNSDNREAVGTPREIWREIGDNMRTRILELRSGLSNQTTPRATTTHPNSPREPSDARYGSELRACAERHLRLHLSSSSGSESDTTPRSQRHSRRPRGAQYDWSSDDDAIPGPRGFPPREPPTHSVPSLDRQSPQSPLLRVNLGPLFLRAAEFGVSPRGMGPTEQKTDGARNTTPNASS